MADGTNWWHSTKDYVNDLKLEMRRVTWPNRKQVEGTTAVVILPLSRLDPPGDAASAPEMNRAVA